ncbi:MAG: bifunctional UDP-N-acetylmuramoyl-tripeptide:D-alanyl-D-alanine ligase/alanine racemase [Duncaniella sp.]|nr:bifunctional UDP-N-acetylmuramoyl-tripeptide:D-alanyl-D-alanine ligase/alanine racemase [Duncaniella sp.]
MSYTISAIASLLSLPSPAGDGKISHLLTDSRSLLAPEETLFFALRTPSGDGHRFISDLYSRGVRHFVVERLPDNISEMPQAVFLTVKSPFKALQTIAAAHRAQFDIPIVAITGSRGKTTIKEWINSLVHGDIELTRSPRSYNSQIGVPLSLWEITPSTEAAVIEAGISLPGEMERLAAMIRPTIGVFANIGGAHSSGFASIQEKAREKARLFEGCHTVIFPADNELIASVIPDSCRKIGWSLTSPNAPLYISRITQQAGNTTIDYQFADSEIHGSYTIPFTARRDVDNSIYALAVTLLLGVKPEVIAERMPRLSRVNTRLEVIEGLNGCHIIHDTFTADIPSLAQALDFANRRITPGHSLTLILGDLTAQCGNTEAVYRQAATLCRARGVNTIIAVGPEISHHANLFGPNALRFNSVSEMMDSFSTDSILDSLILIKGAPDSEFSLVNEAFEGRRHETVLEINLDAVVDNFNFFRSHINPSTGIVCMIKASGYGAGAAELAKTLQTQGAAYLAVAVHDEGAQLRREGITMPIIVLNPMVDDLKTLFDNHLEPEIYSIDFLRRLISEAKRLGVENYPVHIKIDSGMHRLGFLLDTLPEVINLLKGQTHIVARSVFSHLCAADDPLEDDYTRSQFDYFDRCATMLCEAFPERRILRHILNSTGITRFPEHQLDMVRLGIGLYGVPTLHDGSQAQLRPVSTLRTVIISVKEWPAGTTIGYNRRGKLQRDSIIATIPIGYADGLNRHLGYGNASFLVAGTLCPTVGSICMDACMIDVTDVPGIVPGMSVEVFGENISVDSIADSLDTIPYEILTSVSQRVKRIYYRE